MKSRRMVRSKPLLEKNSNELPTNKVGSLARLRLCPRNEKENPIVSGQFDEIIHYNLPQGIIERLPNGHTNNRECLLFTS